MNTAAFQRRSRSRPARDATSIFVALTFEWATPPVALARASMSAVMAATWSQPGVSTFRESLYRFVDGRGLDEIE